MKPKFKLAVVQIRTETDKEKTFAKAEKMISEAADNGAELVVLPEMWSCPYSKSISTPLPTAKTARAGKPCRAGRGKTELYLSAALCRKSAAISFITPALCLTKTESRSRVTENTSV